jgi:hypothetical protein
MRRVKVESTDLMVSNNRPAMGRKRINAENMMARFPAGTLARIEKILRPGENKADFVRKAVEERLSRRETGDDQ